MLKVLNIKKKFTKAINKKKKIEFYADNDISFEANNGEIVGILGPNGAGKTTLLRMISGVLTPTSGKIEFDNLDYNNDSIAIKKKLACLSGNTKLYNSLSPYELLKMCGEFYDVLDDKIEARIEEVANMLGIKDFLHNKIGKLSTGQTQKVNIARCLIHDPKYYILDEVTSGLDIISSQIILDFIKEEKKRGKTILYSTHYMEEAENICDKIVMLDKGLVVYTGTPDKIKKETKTTNLRDAFFEVLKGDKNEK